MTHAFLLYANLVLFLRLWLLLGERAARRGPWIIKTLVEILALGLFELSAPVALAAAASIVANLSGMRIARRDSRREAWQLGLGVAHLLVLSACFARVSGVAYRPEILALSRELAVHSALGPVLASVFSLSGQGMLFGLLLAANEANLFIRAAFERMQLKPRLPNDGMVDAGEYNRGRVIGLLERALIYFFVLNGQFGAIGFTLAAKGFTRFKELENRGFAEYVLIGTLLSSSLALAIGALVRNLTAAP